MLTVGKGDVLAAVLVVGGWGLVGAVEVVEVGLRLLRLADGRGECP